MCKILPIATWPNVNSLVGFINHKTKSQTVCKPGSVPRILRGGSHSSGMIVANHLTRHTRGAGQRQPMRAPYLVLLQAGFTLPAMLPPPRCALTAPFHPYLHKGGGLLSVALSLGLRRAGVTRRHVSMEPGLSSDGRLPDQQRLPDRLTGAV